ncbi:MAG: hypothetical protein V1906_03025 [Candidatus Woesearchaeota archaeon]
MKRGLLIGILIIVALFVAGCGQQQAQPLGPSAPEKTPGLIALPEVPVKEEPLPSAPEKTDAPVETPAPEVKEEPVAETSPTLEEPNVLTVVVKKGDVVDYKKHKLTIDDIGSGTYILFNVDGYKSKFYQSKTSEIVNDLRVSYVQSFFNVNSSIQLTLEEFKTGDKEYLLDKGETVKIGNHTLRLDNVKIDVTLPAGCVAWFSLANEIGETYRIEPGKSKQIQEMKVTVKEAFWRAGNFYAYVKIE